MGDPRSSVEQSGNATASDGGIAISGILHGGIHQHFHPPSQRVPDEAEVTASLTKKFRAYADNELRALVDWGQMRVPWHRLGDNEGELAKEADLARHICGGGRLVIFGDSQSGKTTLAYSLMHRLDAENCPSVLLRLRSWMPTRQRLAVWISGMLRDEYGLHDMEHLRALQDIVEGRLVPIFDGFDEIAPSAQHLASEAFRQFTAGKRAVLTGVRTPTNSRYFDNAVPDAAVIELDPVSADEVGRFLMLKVPPLARPHWEALSGGLAAAPAARTALSKPLNAWLAKTVYAVEDEYTGRVTDLLELRTPGDVEQHLLQRTITAIFTRVAARPDGDDAPSDGFIPAEVEHWLGFLGSRRSNEAIAFWQLRQLAPMYRLGLAGSVLLGVTAALLGGVFPPAAVALFLLTGVLFGFGYARGYSVGRWKAPDDPTRIGYLFTAGKGQKDGDIQDHTRKLVMGAGLGRVLPIS
ncbi:ATP-binding protein [Actinoplanes sp. NPDC048791]|uniref:ATP-binding protein n=1 Tax=Actinoplanes sp. NPDC048791 TaxID=3154623 RepID=UPI0033D9BF8D